MYAESIRTWLKRKSRVEAAFDIAACGVLLVCCVIVLALTWGFGYLLSQVAQFILGAAASEFWRADVPYVRGIDLFVASCFLLLLFLVQLRRERGDADEAGNHQYIAGRDSFFPWALRVSVDTAGEVFEKFVADFVLIGPRLVFFTASLFRRATRLFTLDYWRCAQILEALVRRGRRMSFAELELVVPDANRFHVFDQLRDIDGVIFLLSEPAGVSLVQDLRTELRKLPVPLTFSEPPPVSVPKSPPLVEPTHEFRPPKGPPPVELPKDLAASFYLLGISANASADQVREAYRKKMKECHPDRFTRLGKDWQKLAEDRSKQINLAYEMIQNRR